MKRTYKHRVKCVGYSYYLQNHEGCLFLTKNKYGKIKNESWELEIHSVAGLNHMKITASFLTKELVALRDVLYKAIAKHSKTKP